MPTSDKRCNPEDSHPGACARRSPGRSAPIPHSSPGVPRCRSFYSDVRLVKHSELERQLEGMGRELMRKLLQAHLDMRQPGQAVESVRDAAGTTLTPPPVHARSLESIFREGEGGPTGYGGAGTPRLHPLDGAL